MLKRVLIASVLISLIGTGCLKPASETAKEPTALNNEKPVWVNVADGIQRYNCSAIYCDDKIIIYRFEKNRFNWRLENRATPSTVEAWIKSLPKAVFVVNGVFFDENDQPTGLLKTAGALVNNRIYDVKKSGLLKLAPAISIIDTSKHELDLSKTIEAAQSFPLLIKNGSPVSEFKDTHAARRSFIGTDKDSNIYVGTVPESAITFADLAKLLAKMEIKWDNVLNLDGGTSTGFAARDGDFTETMNSIVQVPNVIIAEKK